MSEWISVQDRIEEDEKVLICFGEPFFGEISKEIGIGYYDSESEEWMFWLNDRPVMGAGVTHWMPLPEMPS